MTKDQYVIAKKFIIFSYFKLSNIKLPNLVYSNNKQSK